TTPEESSEVSSTDEASATPSLLACIINNERVSVVNFETGVCVFTLPEEYETFFNFVSPEDYDIQYYYARAGESQFTNDIRNAGRIISIPARILWNLVSQVHQVHLESASNSTLRKRDEIDDFIASIEDTDGTPIDVYLSAEDADEESSVSPTDEGSVTEEPTGTEETTEEPTGTEETTEEPSETEEPTDTEETTGSEEGGATESEEGTEEPTETEETESESESTTIRSTTVITTTIDGAETIYTTVCPATENPSQIGGGEAVTVTDITGTEIITITSCHNDACHETTVPATLGPVTTTVHGVETVYTTYCPIEPVETVEEVKTVTIVVCKEDKCKQTTVEATPSTVTEVVEQTTTKYVTYKPTSIPEGESVATKVVTSGEEVLVPETSTIVTGTVTEETTVFITVSKVPEGPAPTTVPAAGGQPGAGGEEGTETKTLTETKPGAEEQPGQPGVTGGTTVAEQTISRTTEPSVIIQASESTIPSEIATTFTGAAATAGIPSILAFALIPLAYFI
ncbi:hypothetical protein G210_2593, partial [Candida maltosa Xu316]